MPLSSIICHRQNLGTYLWRTFINIESYSERTVEIKELLLEGYKKLFIGNELSKIRIPAMNLLRLLGLMQKHSSAISSGVTPESLTTIKVAFLIRLVRNMLPAFRTGFLNTIPVSKNGII
jgi:hypothetical protein